MRILEGYKQTVFETRDMPRLAPHCQWDLDITKVEGTRPVAGQPYPVSPQHLPELNRQIMVLEQAGLIRRSRSLYGAPMLFAPKKDGKLRLCIDYRRLNRQTLRDCYPTPIATDLIACIRGAHVFCKLDAQWFSPVTHSRGESAQNSICYARRAVRMGCMSVWSV